MKKFVYLIGASFLVGAVAGSGVDSVSAVSTLSYENNGKKVVEIRERDESLPFLKEASQGDWIGGGNNGNGNGGNNGGGNGNGSGGRPVEGWKDDENGYIGTEGACDFRDISGNKNEWAIKELYARGMVRGRKPCYYQPNSAASRGEAASLSARIMKVQGKYEGDQNVSKKPFPDVEVDNGLAKGVNDAKNADVVHGYPDGNYRPEKNVNKVEALKIYSRTSGSAKRNSKVDLSAINDIENDQWYVRYVNDGIRDGVLEVVNGKVVPAAGLNRGEMAEMAWRFIRAND